MPSPSRADSPRASRRRQRAPSEDVLPSSSFLELRAVLQHSGPPAAHAFDAAVRHLRALSICPPGRERPCKDGKFLLHSFAQGRRSTDCPPGFEALRAITSDKVAYFEMLKRMPQQWIAW